MDTPDSMKAELASWNNGKGIDLESWASCSGTFALAVGYSTVFCPKFIEFEDYILAGEDMSEDAVRNLRSFENQSDSTPMSVEWVLNHFHLVDLQYRGCPDASPDKLIFLGEALKEVYETRLQYYFPDKPCIVEFYRPDDPDDLDEYQISFWQKKHDPNYA